LKVGPPAPGLALDIEGSFAAGRRLNTSRAPSFCRAIRFAFTFLTPDVDLVQDLVNPNRTSEVFVRPAVGPATFDVNMGQIAINPTPLSIFAGDTVVWHNSSTTPAFLLDLNNPPDSFPNEVIFPNNTFSFTFRDPGPVIYEDAIDTRRTGVIDVRAAVVPDPTPAPDTATMVLTGGGLHIIDLVLRSLRPPDAGSESAPSLCDDAV